MTKKNVRFFSHLIYEILLIADYQGVSGLFLDVFD